MTVKKIGVILFIVAFLLIFVGFLINGFKKDATPTATTAKAEKTNTFEKEVEKHAHYVQDGDKDPFKSIKDEEGDLSVDKLNLSFTYLKNVSYKRTAATLIDTSKNYLLFNNYTDVLSFYSKKDGGKHVIDNFTNQAVISPDEEFILYSKNALDEETFYYLDTTTYQVSQFGKYQDPNGDRIKVIDMKYKDGLIYYLLKNATNNTTSVHYIALPAYQDQYSKATRDSVLSVNADKLFAFNNNIYVFNKDTKTLERIILNNTSTPVMEVASESIKEMKSVDYYDDKRWAFALVNDQDQSVILTPQGKITDFKGIMSAKWYDKNYLLVNDNLSLYLYNVKTGKKSVVKTDISYVFSNLTTFTIQTNDGEFLQLKKN